MYESYARSILETGSLRAGRDVFYFQPFSRYVVFAEHALLGDSDVLLAAFNLFALNLSILFLCATARRREWTPSGVALGATASFLILALANSENDVVRLLKVGASELTTWILFPALFALLFAPALERHRTLGVAALAVSLITRLNQAPAILWMLLTLVGLHKGVRTACFARWVVVFSLLASLPLAHNLYYGGQFVFGATSATIPENLVINVGGEADGALLSDQLREHLQATFYYGRGSSYFGGGRLVWVFRGLQLVWCAAVVWVVTRRQDRARWLALAAVAPAYLGVHLIYQVTQYYPRHIIVGHMAMGALAILIGSGPEKARESSV